MLINNLCLKICLLWDSVCHVRLQVRIFEFGCYLSFVVLPLSSEFVLKLVVVATGCRRLAMFTEGNSWTLYMDTENSCTSPSYNFAYLGYYYRKCMAASFRVFVSNGTEPL